MSILKGAVYEVKACSFPSGRNCWLTLKTDPPLCIIQCYLQLVSREDCYFSVYALFAANRIDFSGRSAQAVCHSLMLRYLESSWPPL